MKIELDTLIKNSKDIHLLNSVISDRISYKRSISVCIVRYKIIKGLKMKYVAQYTQIDENDNINLNNIEIAIGLGLVDNLKPSQYFYKALDESQTYKEYDGKSLSQGEKAQKECDIVSINIAKYLGKNGFKFSPMTLKLIHKNIFTGAFEQTLEKYIGVFRDVNITKDEDILGGRSVIYADYDEINELLEYDFELERKKRLCQYE